MTQLKVFHEFRKNHQRPSVKDHTENRNNIPATKQEGNRILLI